jgi:hypothetical protein
MCYKRHVIGGISWEFFKFEYWVVESNWVHSSRRPTIGLSYLPRVIMTIENLVEWWLLGETEVLGENLSQCHFVHHKSHMTCSGANPGRRCGKPVVNRFSYGTAQGESYAGNESQIGMIH